MIKQIDHLGIAVRPLDETVPVYEKALGLQCEHREEIASQKVRTAFFDVSGVHLELLEPTSSQSPIAKFLADRGEGIHHIAFRTDNITGQLAQAATGALVIRVPHRLVAVHPDYGAQHAWSAEGRREIYLSPKIR